MLRITVPRREWFDNDKQEFLMYPSKTLKLEHSLVSISKWESKWKKPFFSDKPRTYEETIDYIQCMTLNTEVGDDAYIGLTKDIFKRIDEYINDPMTATWFNEVNKPRGGRQVITSELIYYWMISFDIPAEYQKWHINRLLTLIRICEIKSSPSKKMSKKAVHEQYMALNAARRKKYGANG